VTFNILIVDDSPVMRSIVRRMLESVHAHGFNCQEAENGQAALDFARSARVDLILTDINMPVMDGEELLRNLETDESLQAIPVIVVSTDKTEGRVQQMMKIGARGYVRKPFMPETLRNEIQRVLGVMR